MRTRAYRRWRRLVKGWRRIREDRAQHGPDKTCPCFGDPDPRIWGRTFSRFADTPTPCSCYACGNPRKWFGHPTLQEQRADQSLMDQVRHSVKETPKEISNDQTRVSLSD